MRLLLLLLYFPSIPSQSSRLYVVTQANVKFRSDAPLELIQASTDNIKGAIDIEKKTFAFIIPVSAFLGFNSPLQREHFNENYLETGKYPYAKFHGKINGDFDMNRSGDYEVNAIGTLDLHGIQKDRQIDSKLSVRNDRLSISASFEIPLDDHMIGVPSVVRMKIAEIIKVDFNAKLEPKS